MVLAASDAPLPVDALDRRAVERGESGAVVGRRASESFAGRAQVLTDDDAPVDQLLTPYTGPRA